MTYYFTDRDLFPGGVAVNSPTDPIALHFFDGKMSVLHLENLSPFRMFVSFDHAVASGVLGSPPPAPQVLHDVLEIGAVLTYENLGRSHVTVWLDPAAVPAGPCPLRVTARS